MLLFRGFVPTRKGTSKIKHGDKYIKGLWVYWGEFGKLLSKKKVFNWKKRVVLGTISQATSITDMKGHFVFDGDVIENYIFCDGVETIERLVIEYDEMKNAFMVKGYDRHVTAEFLEDSLDNENFKIVKTIWE